MNQIPLHPILVHVPVAVAVLMPLVTFGLLLALWRNWLPKRAWVLAIVLQAVLVGGGVLAVRSGEADEDRVERVVPEAAIEAHAEAAETFVWGSGVALALMLLPLLLRKDGAARLAMLAAATATVIVFGLGYRAGRAGGELVYRHGAAAAFAGSAGATDQPGHSPPAVDDDGDR
jgi:uncharacterized membrane protein